MIWKLSMVWGAAMLFAIVLLQLHVARPGQNPSAEIRLSPQQRLELSLGEWPCLLLVQSPVCPCARTTRQNLARVLAKQPGNQLRIMVINVGPAALNSPQSLSEGMAALPGVEVLSDPSGQLAAALGVKTSGHVMLFDSQGRRLFSGGITAGRGHAGQALGLVTLEKRLRENLPVIHQCKFFPVWGCPLSEPRGGQ